SEKRIVTLKNILPENIVPNSDVVRLLTINGEIGNETAACQSSSRLCRNGVIKNICSGGSGELPGEVVSVLLDPKGLKQLLSLPPGSVIAELERLLPLIQVYQYLETKGIWDVLGADIEKNSDELKQKIKNGGELLRSRYRFRF
ncbi:hypothetical protein XENOCAPTIV_006289, partial [Xenoophorus captivus]